MTKNSFLIMMICIMPAFKSLAQTLPGNAGGTTTAGNISMSWAVGEAMTGSVTNSTNSFIAGFLQPEPLTVTALSSNAEKRFKVFPNPAYDRVILQRGAPGDHRVYIYDINGKTVAQSAWNEWDEEKEFLTGEWTAGVYIIHIFENGKVIHESRLLKL